MASLSLLIARISRGSVLLAALALLASGSASASGGWKHVRIDRHQGAIRATLSFSYETRPSRSGVLGRIMLIYEYRQVTLLVRRAGKIVINDIWQGNPFGGQFTMPLPAGFALTLRNVWGNVEPEALVTLWTGGNRCCDLLEVGLFASRDRGRVLFQSFPLQTGVPEGNWYDGRFDFYSEDLRFICRFTVCADSSAPIQIFAINKEGTKFVDVTRSRPDLVRSDAAGQWQEYLRVRGKPNTGVPVGPLAPWCADEYLLGQKERCDRALTQAFARGYGSGGLGPGRRFIKLLHKTLSTWGYDRR